MSWSNVEVRRLIEEVEKYPCLYVVKSANYKNKHSRKQALGEIVKTLSRIRPAVTESEVKSKFNGIKSNFFTEHRKVVASQKSGAGSDDVYKPTLWYYELLAFILQHYETRCAYDSLGESSQTQTEMSVGQEDEIMEEDGCVYTLDSETGLLIPDSNDHSENEIEESSLLGTPKVNNKNTRKRKKSNIEDNSQFFMESTKALRNLTGAMESKHTNNLPDMKNHTLANYIVSKLGEIHEDIKVDVEMKLINVLFEGVKQSKNM